MSSQTGGHSAVDYFLIPSQQGSVNNDYDLLSRTTH